MNAREEILARVRTALRDVPRDETPDDVQVPRDYRSEHAGTDPHVLTGLLAENLADYRAHVHRCTPSQLPGTIADLLRAHGSRTVAVPADLPAQWLSGIEHGPHSGLDDGTGGSSVGGAGGDSGSVPVSNSTVRQVPDSPGLTARELDAVDSVVTGCALAIAETGTIVLDAGPGQGRRVLTLVPDHHICVVRAPAQVVASVPQALAQLEPGRPQTWISGPSATSDIELDRVEGVHGPRLLDVVLVSEF